MTDADDPLPGILAEIDQMVATLPTVMRVLRACYDTAKAEGFTADEALKITMNYHATMLRAA